MDGQVTALYCHPVKSCRGIALETAEVRVRGIAYDRQWMVVDARRMSSWCSRWTGSQSYLNQEQ